MAQIEQSDKGKKKKGAQKKMAIHVDFTPMVDMNMLLITFFMLCTTMIKSQTLKIALPTNEEAQTQEQAQKAGESDAVTLYIDTEEKNGVKTDIVKYFFGKPDDPTKVATQEFLSDENSKARGIREVLAKRNDKILKEIETLKKDWRANKFDKNAEKNDSIYEAKAKEVRANKELNPPIVIIKPTTRASWASVISALDEMSINEISTYQIDNMQRIDSMMLGMIPFDAEAAKLPAGK